MKLTEIRNLIQQDSIIDIENLDIESLKIPTLHLKYYELLLNEKRELKALECTLKKKKKTKFEFYMGKASDDVYKEKPLNHRVTKQDLDIYFDSDDELIEIENRIYIQTEKIDLLLEFIKIGINNRGFQIKSAIDFLKFKNGIS